jgi:hypothetical protein
VAGPDGFPACFFQRNWEVLKADVMTAVRSFFQTGRMPEGVNETVIILLPKKDEPEHMRDFRPISLCNVIYKVVSKCMANRMHLLLNDIIAPMQSTFILGRIITDNALIAFKCLHAISHGNNTCKYFGALKLDLTKAYDRVEWGYLRGVLQRLGFQSQWVQWIMECVTIVRYLVRLNNVPLDSFVPSRGLRQGDPLSPYLFLFVANGLSKLLQHQARQQNLHELRICRRASGLSHLLFADDTLLFLEASESQAEVINRVLRLYERCTGQQINLTKCSMMFGSLCIDEQKEKVLTVLNVASTAVEEKYLGLPTPEGCMGKEKFKSTKERLVKRFSN